MEAQRALQRWMAELSPTQMPRLCPVSCGDHPKFICEKDVRINLRISKQGANYLGVGCLPELNVEGQEDHNKQRK